MNRIITRSLPIFLLVLTGCVSKFSTTNLYLIGESHMSNQCIELRKKITSHIKTENSIVLFENLFYDNKHTQLLCKNENYNNVIKDITSVNCQEFIDSQRMFGLEIESMFALGTFSYGFIKFLVDVSDLSRELHQANSKEPDMNQLRKLVNVKTTIALDDMLFSYSDSNISENILYQYLCKNNISAFCNLNDNAEINDLSSQKMGRYTKLFKIIKNETKEKNSRDLIQLLANLTYSLKNFDAYLMTHYAQDINKDIKKKDKARALEIYPHFFSKNNALLYNNFYNQEFFEKNLNYVTSNLSNDFPNYEQLLYKAKLDYITNTIIRRNKVMLKNLKKIISTNMNKNFPNKIYVVLGMAHLNDFLFRMNNDKFFKSNQFKLHTFNCSN